jgi:NTE family protein
MGKDVALVLSSGGARGYAHIGAIKVLKQYGFNITSISGTSMGALVGGIYATGQLSQFEEWILSLDIMEILKLTDFSISKKGIVKGKKIIERIKQIVPDRNIEDLAIPFCAVATDIIHGTEVIFTKGDLYDAIRASIAIPTVFQPKKIDDHYYVDGGLLNPIPVDRVTRHEGDLLVVVDVSSPIPYERGKDKKKEEETVKTAKGQLKKIEMIQYKLSHLIPTHKNENISIFNLTNRSISTMIRRISELSMEKHQPDLLINISKESFSLYDFYKAKEIIEEGEIATLNALIEGGFMK